MAIYRKTLNSGTSVEPTYINQAPFITYIDYNSGTNATYIGHAAAGTLLSDPTWQIQFLTYDGNNNPTSITFANGSGSFGFVWNSRASYTYS